MTILTAPRGTEDVLPPDSTHRYRLETALYGLATRFGYEEIRTPMFEATELFVRGVGETTDIVEKEMYTFRDKGDRSITLRPEWTAPVVRAMLEKKRLGTQSHRLFYIGPFFRYERPQAGRLRQAHQFGVEFFGVPGPEADHETVSLAWEVTRAEKLASAQLSVNSIGDTCCRPAYREALLAHFRPHAAELSPDSQSRLERNPMRILDSKSAIDQPFIASAPAFTDLLCEPCLSHFQQFCAYLDATGIPYTVDPRLVRGFDYYTRTVFEITAGGLGAQTAICGGGRYDGLVASLGGPATPAVGFGMGIERLMLALAADGGAHVSERSGIQLIAIGDAALAILLPLAHALRRASSLPVFIDFDRRKVLSQLKIADRNNARFALIAGDNELANGNMIFRDLASRNESQIALLAETDSFAQSIIAESARHEKGPA